MDKKSLVISHSMTKEMEFSGEYLVKQLKKINIDVAAAMWFFYSDISSWKYILITSEFEEKGPAFIYDTVNKINRESLSTKYKRIPLSSIEAKGKDAFIYKIMRSAFRIENSSVRMTSNMINGLEIEDCLVYTLI
ncbi:TPA: hypothetical protein ACWW53_001432 [Klebsiella pneumoniae]